MDVALMRLCVYLLSACALFSQAPTVRSIVPRDGATGVPLNARVMVSHSDVTVQPQITVTLTANNSVVRGSDVQAPNRTRPWTLFIPQSQWLPDTEYEVTATLPGQPPVRSRFKTGTAADTAPLRILATEPANGATSVPANQPVRIRFNKPVDPSTAIGYGVVPAFGSFLPNVAFGVDDDGLSIVNNDTRFDESTIYRVSIPFTPPSDWAGNPLDSQTPDISFSTQSSTSPNGPRVITAHPADGENGVPINASLSLRFDRNLRTVPPPSAIELRLSNGQLARFTLQLLGPAAVRIDPVGSWVPNQQYNLTVTEVQDQFGGRMNQPYTVSFKTGTTNLPGSIGWLHSIAPTIAGNARIIWRSLQPVSDVLPPVITVEALDRSPAPPQPRLSPRTGPGGTTLELDRQSFPARGVYRVGISAYDRYQLYQISSSDVVRFDTGNDTTPPAYFTDPSPGSSSNSPDTTLQVLSREPLYSVEGKAPILRRGNATIPLLFQGIGGSLWWSASWRPASPLTAGEYEWDVTGLSDAAGNEIRRATQRFTISANPPQPLQLLSVLPANDAFDVPPEAPVVFSFNRPPPAATLLTFTGLGIGDWIYAGNTVTFRPALPWQERSLVRWGAAGIGSPGGSFRVARTNTVTPLEVTRIDPPAGTPITPGTSLDIYFDRPVLFDASAAALRSANAAVPFRVSYNSVARRATIIPEDVSPFAKDLELLLSSAILDEAGNRLTPFAARFPVQPFATPPSASTPLLDVYFGDYFPPSQPIVVFLRPEAAPDMVERDVRIEVDGLPAAGDFVWTADRRAFTFRPAQPWKVQSVVSVRLSYAALGIPDRETYARTVNAPAPLQPNGTLPPVIPSTLSGWFPRDGIVELRFARDLPAGILDNLTAEATTGAGASRDVLAFRISQPSPRILQLRPDRDFRGGVNYSLGLRTGGQMIYSNTIVVSDVATREFHEFTGAPTQEMGLAPVNVLIRAAFDTLINPASLSPLLEGGGEVVPLESVQNLSGALSYYFRPLGLLRSNTEYRVTLSDLADRTGRPIPPQSWTFTTGDGADRAGFRPLRLEPVGLTPLTARPKVQFNKPVYPAASTNNPYIFQSYVSSISSPGFQVHISPDGRTAELIPSPAWPEGGSIDGEFRIFKDWTGSSLNYGLEFRAPPVLPEFSARAGTGGPARISAANPANGAPEVPRNALVQVRFDGYATGDTLELLAGNVPTETTLAKSDDGRIFTLQPRTLLDENTTYTVRFQGEPVSSFTTGSDIDVKPFAMRVEIPAAGEDGGALFRITSDKPLNPVLTPLSPAQLTINNQRLETRTDWSPDRRRLLVFPAAPLPAGSRPALRLAALTDWTGFFSSPDATYSPDRALQSLATPRALQRFPEHGSVVPAATPIQVTFDQPITGSMATISARLWESGTEIPIRIATTQRQDSIALQPVLPLFPGESYEVEVRGVQGATGATAERVRWAFTTQPSPPLTVPMLQLLSVTPPAGAVGVPTDQRVTLAFNRPAFPDSEPWFNVFLRAFIPTLQVTADGDSLLIAPQPQWPAGEQIGFVSRVSGYQGDGLAASVSFSTAPSADKQPPTVTGMSPDAGAAVPPGDMLVSLVFSEPVLIPPGGLQVDSNLTFVRPPEAYVLDTERRRWAVPVRLNLGETIRISTNPAIIDLSGNPVVPFTREFRAATDDPLAAPGAALSAPAPSAFIPRDTKFEIRFQLPMNESATRNAFRLSEDRVGVPFTAESQDQGRLWRITPDRPLTPGAGVELRVEDTALSAAGVLAFGPRMFYFQVTPSAQPAGLSQVVSYIATPTHVDILFSGEAQERPQPFGIREGQQRVPMTVEHGGRRWLRLQPQDALRPGVDYHLMLGPDQEIPFRIESSPEPEAAPAHTDGFPRLNRPRNVHPFDAEETAPETAHISADGKQLLLEQRRFPKKH